VTPYGSRKLVSLVARDFFTVPTVTFRVLFVRVILAQARRRSIHLNVTAQPTAPWMAPQVVEACPWDEAPRYLLRDRDRLYGTSFRQRVKHLGIQAVMIGPRSPWQTPYVERLIGSMRRELLDHIIVLNEQHLKRLRTQYLVYYHGWRTPLSLAMDCPEPRAVQTAECGGVIAVPELGELHHHYERRAA
jgi:putative transposase